MDTPRAQGPIASDLAALEAIWGMYLRNNITHPVCLGGAAPKLACLCCLQIVLCALHGEMKKLEGKVFSSVSKAPRNFNQTEVESLVWGGCSNQRGHIGTEARAKIRGIVTCL